MQKIKKILFITSLYVPHVGGVETMVKELSNLYIKEGYKVGLLTKKWPKDLKDFEQIDGVDVFRVLSARTEGDFLKLINQIKTYENELKSDIVHIVGIRRPLPLIGLLLARKWGVPVIQTIAGGDIPDRLDKNPGIIWEEGKELIPETLLQSDSINAVSNYLAKDLLKLLPEIKKVETLYAGINFDEIIKIKPENFTGDYIFSFRRLDPSKGIDLLIKSFNLIKGDFPRVNLVIAGDGSERQYLEGLVKRYNLSERVNFIGTVDLEKGISLLKGAALTVVPSLSEGGGLVNIEAQAAGCPVVASNVGGIPEYAIDDYSCLLFNPGDIYDLAKQITKVLKNKELRNKLIDGGYHHARKFDWKSLLPQYVGLYNVLSKNHDKDKVFVPWSSLTKKLWLELNSCPT